MPLKAAFLTVNAGALREDLNAEAPRRSEDAIVLCMGGGGGSDLVLFGGKRRKESSRGRNILAELKGRAQGSRSTPLEHRESSTNKSGISTFYKLRNFHWKDYRPDI